MRSGDEVAMRIMFSTADGELLAELSLDRDEIGDLITRRSGISSILIEDAIGAAATVVARERREKDG